MDANTVAKMTIDLMTEHGLTAKGWVYKPSKAKTYSGQCRYRNKTIAISLVWAEHFTEAELRDTILHEIAHALAGYAAKHSMTWKRLHLSLGGNGEVRFTPSKEALAAVYKRPTSTTPATPTVTRFSPKSTKTYGLTYVDKYDAGFTDFDSMFGY